MKSTLIVNNAGKGKPETVIYAAHVRNLITNEVVLKKSQRLIKKIANLLSVPDFRYKDQLSQSLMDGVIKNLL